MISVYYKIPSKKDIEGQAYEEKEKQKRGVHKIIDILVCDTVLCWNATCNIHEKMSPEAAKQTKQQTSKPASK